MLLGSNIIVEPITLPPRARPEFSQPPKSENMRRVYAYGAHFASPSGKDWNDDLRI